jgi:hypothetical protein
MSKFRKPVVDISSNAQFPILSSFKVPAAEEPVWNCEKVTRFSDNAKYFENGDVYEGTFDELGLPCYGKMTFANGNVYEGPIRDYWIKDDEEEQDEEEETTEEAICEDEYYDYEEEEQEEEQIYGKMTYPDGRVFWGSFCFAQRSKWI